MLLLHHIFQLAGFPFRTSYLSFVLFYFSSVSIFSLEPSLLSTREKILEISIATALSLFSMSFRPVLDLEDIQRSGLK